MSSREPNTEENSGPITPAENQATAPLAKKSLYIFSSLEENPFTNKIILQFLDGRRHSLNPPVLKFFWATYTGTAE